MTSLLAYMQLTDPTSGRCVELFNGARTLCHLRHGRASAEWHESTNPRRWAGQEAWVFDEGNYHTGGNPDPWHDPLDPATSEVAGFLPDAPGHGLGFNLEPALSSRVVGSNGVERLELLVTGTVVSSTQRGELAWVNWAQRLLANRCADARGWDAQVFSHIPCPDELGRYFQPNGPPIYPEAPNQAPADAEVCDPAPPLLEPYQGAAPTRIDDGVRWLTGLRFEGIDQLSDSGAFSVCTGRRWVLRFSVAGSVWHTRPSNLAALQGPWDPCETLTSPFTICPSAGSGASDCGPVDPYPRRRVVPRSNRYVTPRCFMRSAELTSPQPGSLTGRVHATLHGGAETVRNARLVMWHAIEGIASPATEKGHQVYKQTAPVFEARVPVIGNGQKIVMDGRNNRVTLHCADGSTRTGPGIVEAEHGGPWQPPALACGGRYWVALDLSANDRSRGALDLAADLKVYGEELPA